LKKTVLQINVTLNSGSTGRIAENIGKKIIQAGGVSYIAYGRRITETASFAIKIGTLYDLFIQGVQTRLFDKHSLGAKMATKDLIREISRINPDIIHLHNLHGYYLNIELLFSFLKEYNKPVVWTFHDCWPFTGHCTFFDHINCTKWESECFDCPLKSSYPASYLLDQSKVNFVIKKKLFTSLDNLSVVTVSNWLRGKVEKSFFRPALLQTIYNGIDLSIFKPGSSDIKKRFGIDGRKYILGVADRWSERKGFDDFLKLRKMIDPEILIFLVGLNSAQRLRLPKNIKGIRHTENIKDLAALYAEADVFVNPSILESFGMVTAEAMACGTPVVVYNCTASPGIVKPGTGYVVEKRDIKELHVAVMKIISDGKEKYSAECRRNAENLFDMEKQYSQYIDLYNKISPDNPELNT